MEAIDLNWWRSLLIFTWIASACAFIMVKLRLPTLVGYLLAGILLANFLTSTQSHALENLAQSGLIFLLFTLGLETNLEYIVSKAKLIMINTTLILAVLGILIGLCLMLVGFDLLAALFLGQILSFSSTAVVTKLIQERGDEHHTTESLGIGILLWQDILAIPAIILLGSLGTQLGVWSTTVAVFLALFKTILVVGLIYIVGSRFVPPLMRKLVRLPAELHNLIIIFCMICIVVAFSFLGISPVIGAFLAGVLIGHTKEHAHIFGQIKPIKELLVAVFFLWLGSTMSFGVVEGMIGSVVFFTILLLIVKFLVLMIGYFLIGKLHIRIAFSLALMMSQIGEFAFIIFYVAYQKALLSEEHYVFLLSATVLSLLISTPLIRYRQFWYLNIRKLIKHYAPKFWENIVGTNTLMANLSLKKMNQHIIICGYGKIGSYIGRALQMCEIDFVAVDYNRERVAKFSESGVHMIYGDPTDAHIMDSASIDSAALLIITISHKEPVERIILFAKQRNPKIKIITRLTSEENQHRLKNLGADLVIQPDFEAALVIVRKVLSGYNIDKTQTLNKIKRLKIEHGLS